jgi:GT2 family glycosyltransferase
VIVIDDGSSDASPAEAAAAGAVVETSPGRGFSAAVNHGARVASGDGLLILNSDCFLEPEAIGDLVSGISTSDKLALCGAALTEPDGSHARSHGHLLTLGLAVRTAISLVPPPPPDLHGLQRVEFLPLACVLVRRDAWDAVHGLDERFPFYFEDHDLCRRLSDSGRLLAISWDARATHVGGGSSLRRDEQRWFVQYARSRAIYLRKHYPRSFMLFAVVWFPMALCHAALWAARRSPESRRWARAWVTAARVGVAG